MWASAGQGSILPFLDLGAVLAFAVSENYSNVIRSYRSRSAAPRETARRATKWWGDDMCKMVRVVARAAVAVLSLSGLITVLSAAPASASGKAPIVIGYITDETGAASSTYINAVQGAQARIDAQNAIGGVDGHKLELVAEDDQSTPTGNSTAAHLLVSKGAFGIIEDNSGAFGSSRYLNQLGVPVVGASVDGPEWGEQPNTNMFSIVDL